MYTIKTISDYHRIASIPAPKNPLISVIKVPDINFDYNKIWERFAFEFYIISVKRYVNASVRYGQKEYKHDNGIMSFISPNQLHSIKSSTSKNKKNQAGEGYMLMFHPDFITGLPLANHIKSCNFFTYSLNETLSLSLDEEQDILRIFQKIAQEITQSDVYDQDIILSQIDLILLYSKRFYEKQFLVKIKENNLLAQLEAILNNYFSLKKTHLTGIPSVEYLAQELHISANYLSDVLKKNNRPKYPTTYSRQNN
ncbi:AraC family transcriptional regulator [Chryseobacterium sp.]|uniref:AraC family transcriptional regulator n=1 Tax=Chryseobacterium sp. TaxID=1871047 RepID=UPI0035C7609F